MNLGIYIKEYRENNDMTMEAFAKRSGMSKGYVSMLERNRNPKTDEPIVPSLEMIKKVATTIGMDLDDLIDQLDSDQSISLDRTCIFTSWPPQSVSCLRIPILGKISAGVPLEAIQDVIGYEEVSEQRYSNGLYFALEISGDSMLPYMLNGDVAIIKHQDTLSDGEIGVIMVNGEDATVKKFIKTDNYVKLIPYNHNYNPFIYTKEECEQLPVKIVGKVVEVRRKLK